MVDPDNATPLPGALAALHELSGKLAVTAAVSGRSVEFLARKLALDTHRSQLRAIGLHGLEEKSADGTVSRRAGAETWRPELEVVRDQLRAAVPTGVGVEDKDYGITVHWRSLNLAGGELETVAVATTAIVTAIAAEHGLLARRGKASVELALPLGIDKGTVVTELCAGLETAAYLGDDTSDLPGFRALDALAASSGLIGVKITVLGAEAPPEMLEEADLTLEGPLAAAAFLEALAGRLRA